MSGRLRAVQHGVRQDLIFTDMEAGTFFGELAAFDGAPRSLSVFAVNDSLVAKMPSAVFVETMFTHRPLGEAVIATLVARLARRRAGSANLARSTFAAASTPSSCALLVLIARIRSAQSFWRRRTQSELASRINTRRETVSREINAMERRRPHRAPAGRHRHHRRAAAQRKPRSSQQRVVRRRRLTPCLVSEHPPPVLVFLPIPTRGWRRRREEPDAGFANPFRLLAEHRRPGLDIGARR